MWKLAAILLTVVHLGSTNTDRCNAVFVNHGISKNYNETIAHAIHSFTRNDLEMFESFVPADNGVPVVNPKLNDPRTTIRVLDNAPEELHGHDFNGDSMNTIDYILNNIGVANDGLGPNWSPLERIVHKFHMKDLWQILLPRYNEVKDLELVDAELCGCLKDVKSNGIFEAVDWVARHYKTGTPITLLNRKIPKLTDAKSWSIWRMRLLHYYDNQALDDAAKYLVCALYF